MKVLVWGAGDGTHGAHFARADHTLVDISAKTCGGIWRDLAVRKRRTEVDPQLGAIVQADKKAQIATPLTERLIDLIHDTEQGRRTQGWDALETLRQASSAGVA